MFILLFVFNIFILTALLNLSINNILIVINTVNFNNYFKTYFLREKELINLKMQILYN